jgi:hypothetical protein
MKLSDYIIDRILIDSKLLSRYEIADKYGIPYWQVLILCKGKKKTIKLNEETRQDIAAAYERGDTILTLAKEYEVSIRTIEKILINKNIKRRNQGPQYDTHLRDVVRKSRTETHFDALYRSRYICAIESSNGLKEDLTKYHC